MGIPHRTLPADRTVAGTHYMRRALNATMAVPNTVDEHTATTTTRKAKRNVGPQPSRETFLSV